MDIKMMHEMIEKLTECAKAEMDKKGIEELDAEEFSKVTDMLKDLSEAMYYRTITEAMKEAEYGEDYDYMGAYDEHERRGYTGQPRSKTSGRFMRRGDGRRSYMPMMRDYDWDDMEYQRDMDRNSHNRMYYTDGSVSGSSSMGGSQSSGSMGSQGGNRGYSDGGRGNSESRYDRARRGYEESKAMHKSGSVEDKKKNMESLEHYMKELSEEMAELIESMDASEKTMVRSKLQTLAQKVQ